jgi:hypothetical protein
MDPAGRIPPHHTLVGRHPADRTGGRGAGAPGRVYARGVQRRGPGRWLVVGACLCLVALAAACSDDTAAPSSTTRTTESTTTTVATTSSTSVPDGGPGSTTSIPEDVPGDTLPDGDQVGFIHSIDLGAGTATVDLAELLTGPAAARAYREDTGSALDGELIYLRNRDPRLRTVRIDPKGSYAVIYSATCCGPTSVPVEGLAEAVGGDWQGISSPDPPFNLTVTDGTLVAAVQIYRP